jgi:hypothetical protein
MWNVEDKNGFEYEKNNNRGQINLNQNFGKLIFELAKDFNNKIFVDIGTWNGLGSTKCFIEAMKLNQNSILYTIENNTEKIDSAKNSLSNDIESNKLDVRFLNGTFISNDEIDRWIIDNKIVLTEQQQYWLTIDKTNSENLLNINFETIDILLIDGSDYSGYLELQLFKDISKFILLDDVNGLKNKMSREYLINSSDFKLEHEDLNDRDGYSIFSNKKLIDKKND